MQDDVVSAWYAGSHNPVRPGDSVTLDDHPGRIEQVCMPGTEAAEHLDCEEAGALVIRFEDGVVAVIPFGHYHQLVKRC